MFILSMVLREKSITMTNHPAFWFGQLLNCADTLHEQYSEGKRPGELLGEQYISRLLASASFLRDVAMFKRRLAFFAAWARRNAQKSLANVVAGRIGKLEGQISSAGWLPSRLSDEERCMMAAGYFARSPKNGTNQNSTKEKTDE
jgi:hypothetical protein